MAEKNIWEKLKLKETWIGKCVSRVKIGLTKENEASNHNEGIRLHYDSGLIGWLWRVNDIITTTSYPEGKNLSRCHQTSKGSRMPD